jgi:replication initiation protein RepC
MNTPPRVVQLIDLLFAWTQPVDWGGASTPVVWPRNEKLARKLGVKVRQLQNLLNCAVRLGLISHKDSPSGQRGGVRTADGVIKWAYGIVLSPIGARLAEFIAIAERGARDDEMIEGLKRRLTAARRRTSSVAQAVVDNELTGTGAEEELALAQSATRQMRGVRDLALLGSCVQQIEDRGRALEERVSRLLDGIESKDTDHGTAIIASVDGTECIPSTTTNKLQTANAVTSNGSAEESSESEVARSTGRETAVEADLVKHGVDPDFIETVAPELCGRLPFERGRGWGSIIHLAEQLASRHRIHRHAWHEAARLMGQRGAAAAVIAVLQKYQTGDVDRPGAYLRGMSERAAKGELHLGRTFHGLKDQHRSVAMRAMHNGDEPRSVGELARYAVTRQLVLSGRSSDAKGTRGRG